MQDGLQVLTYFVAVGCLELILIMIQFERAWRLASTHQRCSLGFEKHVVNAAVHIPHVVFHVCHVSLEGVHVALDR